MRTTQGRDYLEAQLNTALGVACLGWDRGIREWLLARRTYESHRAGEMRQRQKFIENIRKPLKSIAKQRRMQVDFRVRPKSSAINRLAEEYLRGRGYPLTREFHLVAREHVRLAWQRTDRVPKPTRTGWERAQLGAIEEMFGKDGLGKLLFAPNPRPRGRSSDPRVDAANAWLIHRHPIVGKHWIWLAALEYFFGLHPDGRTYQFATAEDWRTDRLRAQQRWNLVSRRVRSQLSRACQRLADARASVQAQGGA